MLEIIGVTVLIIIGLVLGVLVIISTKNDGKN